MAKTLFSDPRRPVYDSYGTIRQGILLMLRILEGVHQST
jgi:hypothetical protein